MEENNNMLVRNTDTESDIIFVEDGVTEILPFVDVLQRKSSFQTPWNPFGNARLPAAKNWKRLFLERA